MEDIILTLEAMRDNAWDLCEMWKKERKHALRNQAFGNYSSLDVVIRMLTDPEYAAKMKDIFRGA